MALTGEIDFFDFLVTSKGGDARPSSVSFATSSVKLEAGEILSVAEMSARSIVRVGREMGLQALGEGVDRS